MYCVGKAGIWSKIWHMLPSKTFSYLARKWSQFQPSGFLPKSSLMWAQVGKALSQCWVDSHIVLNLSFDGWKCFDDEMEWRAKEMLMTINELIWTNHYSDHIEKVFLVEEQCLVQDPNHNRSIFILIDNFFYSVWERVLGPFRLRLESWDTEFRFYNRKTPTEENKTTSPNIVAKSFFIKGSFSRTACCP